MSSAPVVIEVRGVEKTFRVARHRVDSFKERALHPLAHGDYRELRALRGVWQRADGLLGGQLHSLHAGGQRA